VTRTVGLDTTTIYSKQQRLQCTYDQLSKHALRGRPLVFCTQLEPYQRARERADMIQLNGRLDFLLALRQKGSYLNSRPGNQEYGAPFCTRCFTRGVLLGFMMLLGLNYSHASSNCTPLGSYFLTRVLVHYGATLKGMVMNSVTH
jgi:hypothetical protein